MGEDEKLCGEWKCKDGIVIGVRLIEKFLMKMQEIRI
jgi:hypothetical protein